MMLQKYIRIYMKAMPVNFSWKVNLGHVPSGKEKSVLDMGLGIHVGGQGMHACLCNTGTGTSLNHL